MLLRRCFALLAIGLLAAVPRVLAVSLMNGSELSMQGLNLTVSNCSLVLAGWQQSSCAAGNLALEAVSGSRGTAGYEIKGDGTGRNGTDIFAAAGGGIFNSGLYQLSFTLTVSETQPGTTIRAASLALAGSDNYGCFLLCGSEISASQSFSAAAGGGTLNATLLSAPFVSTVLDNAKSFSINETLTMNSYGPPSFADWWDPATLRLSSARQTFGQITEPATLAVLLAGVAGLAVARWWRLHS